MDLAGNLFKYLDDETMQNYCSRMCTKLRTWIPQANGSKQVEAFQVLSGIKKTPVEGGSIEPLKVLLSKDLDGMSTFLGYYVLLAKAKNNEMQQCLDILRSYWGKMLELGATTFWEDFDLKWAFNANRIDELPVNGQIDIHGDQGSHCYKGFRHSLCHGWASGPAPFLSENVLGVRIIEPGCKVISIIPDLGDLKWVKGTYPTPFGVVSISHVRLVDGLIKTQYDLPEGVELH